MIALGTAPIIEGGIAQNVTWPAINLRGHAASEGPFYWFLIFGF
jgi:hypothetical protein